MEAQRWTRFGVLKVWSEALSVLTQTVEPPHACRLKGDRPHRRSHFMTTPTHTHTLQNLQTLGVIWVSSVICSLLITTINAVSHNKTTKCIYCYWCVKHAQTHIDNTLTLWAVTGGEFRPQTIMRKTESSFTVLIRIKKEVSARCCLSNALNYLIIRKHVLEVCWSGEFMCAPVFIPADSPQGQGFAKLQLI